MDIPIRLDPCNPQPEFQSLDNLFPSWVGPKIRSLVDLFQKRTHLVSNSSNIHQQGLFLKLSLSSPAESILSSLSFPLRLLQIRGPQPLIPSEVANKVIAISKSCCEAWTRPDNSLTSVSCCEAWTRPDNNHLHSSKRVTIKPGPDQIIV